MRKILALFLSLALRLGTTMPAFAATGEGNIDGGGGNMGSGNSSSYWNPGMDGVRVTVINAESHAVVTTPVDLTNKTPSTGIIHFGKVCKLTYNGGASLAICTPVDFFIGIEGERIVGSAGEASPLNWTVFAQLPT